jgi:hypothetical protein
MVLRDRHRAAHLDITRSDHLPPVSATLTRERAFQLASDLVNAGKQETGRYVPGKQETGRYVRIAYRVRIPHILG